MEYLWLQAACLFSVCFGTLIWVLIVCTSSILYSTESRRDGLCILPSLVFYFNSSSFYSFWTISRYIISKLRLSYSLNTQVEQAGWESRYKIENFQFSRNLIVWSDMSCVNYRNNWDNSIINKFLFEMIVVTRRVYPINLFSSLKSAQIHSSAPVSSAGYIFFKSIRARTLAHNPSTSAWFSFDCIA